jgi:hypothetical protein
MYTLRQAMAQFDEARFKLEHAMQLVEQLMVSSETR